MKNTFPRVISTIVLVAIVFLAGGCFGQPRMRMGCLPTSTPGGTFLDPDHLGNHSYGPLGAFGEKDGIVYTCKAGHIDITHLRWNADYTRFLALKTQKTLMKNKDGFSFRIVLEQSDHVISFKYPKSWINMDKAEKEKAAKYISYHIGPYITYLATTWHEIATAYGTHYIGFEPEENSAFSWEDTFSNLLGCHLAVEAMLDKDHSFNKAMTIVLNKKMKELGAIPRKNALAAAEKMRGNWFKGNFAVETKMKNYDIGLDGSVGPAVIPNVIGCSSQKIKYKTFTKDVLKRYGIEMTYEIKPNIFESGKIYSAIGQNKVFPERDYPAIMKDLKQRAKKRNWQWVD